MTTLLGESGGLGYGLPERRAVMTFVDDMAGMEVEWTLGVALTLADPEPLLQKVRVASHYWVQQRQPWSGVEGEGEREECLCDHSCNSAGSLHSPQTVWFQLSSSLNREDVVW